MKRKTSKRMLTVSVFNIVWYTIAAIILQFKVGVEISSTLTTCWYAFWTSEIFVLAGIRISKVIKYEDEDPEEVDDDGMVG
jgi:hypothetical protein